MWFRNARVFRFTKPFNITAEELEEKLAADAFKPCGPQETARHGWVPPLGKHGELLVHSANGYHLVALRKEEKVVPAPVVKEMVEERAEAIELEQGRKVRKKEKDELKEDIMLELLPRAFSRNRRTFAYLAPADGVLVGKGAAVAGEGPWQQLQHDVFLELILFLLANLSTLLQLN